MDLYILTMLSVNRHCHHADCKQYYTLSRYINIHLDDI
jgi:hypothetical protein